MVSDKAWEEQWNLLGSAAAAASPFGSGGILLTTTVRIAI